MSAADRSGGKASKGRPTGAQSLPLAPPRRRRVPLSLPPILRGLAEQALVAGPMFGVLSALYGYHLSQTAPQTPDLATHATIMQSAVWHGHFMHHYYLTAAQNEAWWALSVPAMAWLVLLVVGLISLGIRVHLASRQADQGRRDRVR